MFSALSNVYFINYDEKFNERQQCASLSLLCSLTGTPLGGLLYFHSSMVAHESPSQSDEETEGGDERESIMFIQK